MTIEQAIEYATSGQSSGGPITQDALSVLAGAARDRMRLLDACERFLDAADISADSALDYIFGRVDSSSVVSKSRDRELAFNGLVATVKEVAGFTVKFMGGLAE